MTTLIAPFGFYGWGNIGDEATLQGFANLVSRAPERVRVWLGSANPAHTRRVEPRFNYYNAAGGDWRRRWAHHRASGVVFAGGTPIMDCLGKWPLCDVASLVGEAQDRQRPISFVGVGTERLQSEESRRLVGDCLASHVRHWSVRSGRDRARLIEYGVPSDRVEVAADMAWLLDPVSPDWGARRLKDWGLAGHSRLLGVNVLGEKHVLQREPRLFEKLAEFLDMLVEQHNVFILFLANEVREGATFDKASATCTLAAMKHQQQAFVAPNDYLSPQQMLSLIANCHATVSMRYHFCLFSALQGVPFLALQRSDKVTDLCEDLEWQGGADVKGLTSSQLQELFHNVERQRAELIGHLSRRIPVLRERAGKNLTALQSVASYKQSPTRRFAVPAA